MHLRNPLTLFVAMVGVHFMHVLPVKGFKSFIINGSTKKNRVSPSTRTLAYFVRFSSFRDDSYSSSHLLHWRNFSSSKEDDTEIRNKLSLAENAFNALAKQGRSWKRLRHLVELAVNNSDVSTIIGDDATTLLRRKSIADVGTDHGLLAIALAMTGNYKKVVGVDVSVDALQDGAYKLFDAVQTRAQIRRSNDVLQILSKVEFRHGNGLNGLTRGEADIICIAGMGTKTMIEILSTPTDDQQHNQKMKIHELKCQQVVLQATNSRPKHLVTLYHALNELGYELNDERIENVSRRWYLSSSFVRSSNDAGKDLSLMPLPGSILATQNDNNTFQLWVSHHYRWIQSDMVKAEKSISDIERRWLEEFSPFLHP